MSILTKTSKYFALASLGGVAAAMSMQANAGWYGGDCATYSSGGVCIEYYENSNSSTWHLNSTGSNKGAFTSPAPTPTGGVYSSSSMENFVFSGPTDLSCFDGGVVASCTLTLEGRVSLDASTDTVGIDIVDGDVTGSGTLCSYIDLEDFPWGIDLNSRHTPPWDGLPITGAGPYTGSVGSIGFVVRNPIFFPPTLVNISDSHIHDVVFENNGSSPSTFTFDSGIVENGTDDPTGCAIDGTLTIQGGDDVNIEYN